MTHVRHPLTNNSVFTSGDWGEVGDTDRQENVLALRRQLRLFSVYRDQNQTRAKSGMTATASIRMNS